MNIKPIKTERDYQAALKEIENIFDAKPNTPKGDRLEVLSILIEAYEEKHYHIPFPNPVEALLYHIESRGLSRKDLEPYIGSRARVSPSFTNCSYSFANVSNHSGSASFLVRTSPTTSIVLAVSPVDAITK